MIGIPTDTSLEERFIESLRGMINSQIESYLTQSEVEYLPKLEPSKIRPAVLGNSRMLEWARRVYQIRRYREKQLPPGMFGEPGWDILLDLYIAYHEGRTVGVSSACLAAAVPLSTAWRSIRILEDHGLIHRIDDIKDKRVTWVGLTRKAILAISRICEDDEKRKHTKRASNGHEPTKQEMIFDW